MWEICSNVIYSYVNNKDDKRAARTYKHRTFSWAANRCWFNNPKRLPCAKLLTIKLKCWAIKLPRGPNYFLRAMTFNHLVAFDFRKSYFVRLFSGVSTETTLDKSPKNPRSAACENGHWPKQNNVVHTMFGPLRCSSFSVQTSRNIGLMFKKRIHIFKNRIKKNSQPTTGWPVNKKFTTRTIRSKNVLT